MFRVALLQKLFSQNRSWENSSGISTLLIFNQAHQKVIMNMRKHPQHRLENNRSKCTYLQLIRYEFNSITWAEHLQTPAGRQSNTFYKSSHNKATEDLICRIYKHWSAQRLEGLCAHCDRHSTNIKPHPKPKGNIQRNGLTTAFVFIEFNP